MEAVKEESRKTQKSFALWFLGDLEETFGKSEPRKGIDKNLPPESNPFPIQALVVSNQIFLP